jgi:hypothetical protein
MSLLLVQHQARTPLSGDLDLLLLEITSRSPRRNDTSYPTRRRPTSSDMWIHLDNFVKVWDHLKISHD